MHVARNSSTYWGSQRYTIGLNTTVHITRVTRQSWLIEKVDQYNNASLDLTHHLRN